MSFENWQNVVSAFSGYKISYLFLKKVSQCARKIKHYQCITCTRLINLQYAFSLNLARILQKANNQESFLYLL